MRRLSFIIKNLQVTVSLGILFVFITAAILAPLFAPDDPNTQEFAVRLLPPGGEHLLGTDSFGRDLFSRIIYGARVSLAVGFIATGLAAVLGAVLGIGAAYWGGWFDKVMMAAVDVLMAFPVVLFALLLVTVTGSSLQSIIMAITIALTPRLLRIARAPALAIKELEYIEAARALGFSSGRIILFHILPNTVGTIIVYATLQSGGAIIAEASLSFLGLGIAPPQPSWGNILKEGIEYLRDAYWISLYSGLAIVLIVLALNTLGDNLRDKLDPKLRGEKRP